MKKKRKGKKHILKPLSLWPLKPEDVMAAFMKVDRHCVRERERREVARREKARRALPTG